MYTATQTAPARAWPRVAISSRRYLGGKSKLLPFFAEVVADRLGCPSSFADLFAGTGVVAHSFNAADRPVLANDLLYCNHLSLRCFLGDGGLDAADLTPRIAELNGLAPQAGYATRHFGGRYFSKENAGRIDAIRDTIARWTQEGEITTSEEAVLITALLYAADRVAHTCGHYDAFRRAPMGGEALSLRLPDFDARDNRHNRIFNEDANALTRRIEADVLYLDPPYNSRQYSDCYHLLENLARWEKPEVFGAARKMDRAALKSRYCHKDAAEALDDLVQSAHCRALLLSYNNMGERGNDRSNARIADDDILQILRRRGDVEVYTRTFSAFSAGLADHSEGHEERLFLCRMREGPSRGEARRLPLHRA